MLEIYDGPKTELVKTTYFHTQKKTWLTLYYQH